MGPENTEKSQPVKGVSLRVSMILLVLGCCVLPILLLVGVVGALTSRNNTERVSQLITISIEGAVDSVDKNLETVVNDSLGASYDPTIRDAYAQFGRDGNQTNMYSAIHSFLTYKYSRSPLIQGAYLFLPEVELDEYDMIYATNPEKMTYQDVSDLGEGFYEFVDETIPQLGTEVLFFYQDDRLFLMRTLSQNDNNLDPYAALVLELDTENVFNSMTALPWVTDAAVQLDEAMISLVGKDTFEGEKADMPDSYETRVEDGSLLVWGNSDGERYTLDYWVRADTQQLSSGSNVTLLVAGLCVIAALLVAILFLFLHRKVTKPISELGKMTGRIEQGEFGAQVDTDKLGSREFRSLGKNLNAMSTRLDYQFERLYSEELALRDAKIKALQSQVNPRFLGNTLQIIQWQARLDGKGRVSQMLEALSTMIEATQDPNQKPFVHLSEEMLYVNSYLFIVGERHGKRLDARKEIEEELLDWLVPRLVLQPLVENAIEHSTDASMRSWLIIRAYRLEQPPPLPEEETEMDSMLRQEFDGSEQGQWFRIEVENSEVMSEKEEEAVRKLLAQNGEAGEDTGSAIGNVNQRLKMIYGPRSGLTIQNTKDGTTLSSINIMRREESEDTLATP